MTNRELQKMVEMLTDNVSKLSKDISILTDKFSVLEKKSVEPSAEIKKEAPPVIPTVTSPGAQTFPLPYEYQELVQTILNGNFGVEVKALADRPAFEFIISVPKKYSNAPEMHWKTHGCDIRPKVITYAEGVNGVKEWCQRVLSNFDQDRRTMISLDRDKLLKEQPQLVNK